MRIFTRPGRIAAMLLTFALVFAAAPVSAGQIQEFDPDFYASELTGIEIEVSGPLFEITEAELQHYPTGEGEVVQIGSDTAAAGVEVSFFDDGDSPQESLDIYLSSMESAADSVEVIDRGIDGDLHYLLAMIQFDGVDIVYFLQVEEDIQGNVDMLQAILTAASMFEVDLEDAQAEVLVDGIPFMDTVDPAEVADVVAGNGSLGENQVATPAMPADTFTFPESGVEVGIGSDFSFVGEPDLQPDIEVVRIQGPSTLSMVAVGETGSSPEVVLNSFSSGIATNYAETEVVDEEIGGEYAWRLLSIPKDLEESTFMLVIVDVDVVSGYEVMQAHEVSSDSVAGGLVTIQEQVTLNGAPIMPDIDPEEIAEIADGAPTEESTQTSETPVATEETPDGRSGDPREDARLPETGGDDDDAGNTSETGENTTVTPEPVVEPTRETAPDDDDVQGTLSGSSWEGGVFGHVIEWDAETWFVDTEFEGDIVSNEEMLEDTIVLQAESADGTSWLYISVYGGDDLTPQEYLDHWASNEYLSTFSESGAEAEVVEFRTRGGNSAVLLRITAENGSEYLVVRQAVTLESGEVLVVTLDTPAADMVVFYTSAQDVTIDGEATLYVFSPSQIQRVIGD